MLYITEKLMAKFGSQKYSRDVGSKIFLYRKFKFKKGKVSILTQFVPNLRHFLYGKSAILESFL